MSVFHSGAVLIRLIGEVDRRDAVHERELETFGYGMNQWAKSEGSLPAICPVRIIRKARIAA